MSQSLLGVGSKGPFTESSSTNMDETSPQWVRFSTQREACFRDGETVLVASETLLLVVPEAWRREMRRARQVVVSCTTPGSAFHMATCDCGTWACVVRSLHNWT